MVASVLEGGAVFKLYYPNYSTFLGTQHALPKAGVTRFNISTQSLDMVISTFQVQDRETQQAPILGQGNATGWGSLPGDNSLVGASSTTAAASEYGTHLKSFNYALQLGVAKTLNKSKYFVRNGDGIDRCTYSCGVIYGQQVLIYGQQVLLIQIPLWLLVIQAGSILVLVDKF